MFGLESGELQALWQPTIITNIDSLMEKPFDRFCD